MHMYQCQDIRLELVCQNIPLSEGQGQQNLQEGICEEVRVWFW